MDSIPPTEGIELRKLMKGTPNPNSYFILVDPSVIEIISIIEEGQKQGIVREMNKVLLCQLLYGMITTVIKGYLAEEYPLDEYEIQQTIDACWKSIKV
ncbi:hypothetical protein [Cohnella abietis]|uniref:HTH-type transcriptional repressor C-terminal domain-containing protein n=1 Tax=Cohnella abietis TaxID=2507935 RepID=A0A3T1D623_9BACL|nr:hypothetical protein [Cohnella abietis]BBI33485.1 hypothetical protein KCTCHS21_28840 [Cohnella abietis]